MRCVNCGNENPPGLRFCEQCAVPLDAPSPVAVQPETIKCFKCGTLNRPEIKYCEQCAAPLTTKATTRPTRRRIAITGIAAAAGVLIAVGVIAFLFVPGNSPQNDRHQPQLTQQDGLRDANEIVKKSFPGLANVTPVIQETTFGADKGYRYLYRTGQPVATDEGLIDTRPSVTIIINAVTKKTSVMVSR